MKTKKQMYRINIKWKWDLKPSNARFNISANAGRGVELIMETKE